MMWKKGGRWLDVLHHVGSDLCYWLIIDSGQVVSKSVWMILTLFYRERMASI
jgi:hypothetical protein